MFSRFSSFMRTRLARETATGLAVIAVFLCWLFWDEIRLAWQFQQAPIAGLEREATMGYSHDPVKGEALYNEALALEDVKTLAGASVKDQIKARALYLDAVRYGYTPAIGRLGMSYLNIAAGPYLPVDAIKLFNRGTALNDTNSMRGLGLVYAEGIDGVINQDENRAVELFVKAAELGDVEAQYLAGVYYLGQNILLFSGNRRIHPYRNVDEKKGMDWMNRAITNGLTKPYKAIAWYFEEKGDFKRAELYAREGAMKGNTSCMHELYLGYAGSNHYFGNDPERGECYRGLFYSMSHDREVPIPNLDELCPPTRKGP